MATHDDHSCDPETRFKLLSSIADSVQVDRNIPPKRYFRSGVEMEQMASVYLNEGNIENAFLLYMKYIVLFVEKLPKHPLYKQADPVQLKRSKENVRKVFPITEKLRSRIKKLYAEEYEQWKEEENRKIQEEKERRQRQEDKENQRRKEEEEERKRQLQQLERQQRKRPDLVSAVVPTFNPSAPLIEEDYPVAPEIIESVNDRTQIPDAPPPAYSPPPAFSPPAYKQEDYSIPSASQRIETEHYSNEIKSSVTPVVDRATKPTSIFDRQISTPVHGLRRVYVPQELVSKFLSLASHNTTRNLETCGILTGRLAKNLFHITHLVVPKQTATSDSCTTTNEEEMFDVQDKYDLVTLGWIHTHPSQTSFLSSVDLHTHYAYQMLMPEAIAIVCSPKYNQVGVYRLTTNYGMNFIGSCSKPGFHPHPKEPPLFEESEHVQMDTTMGLKIVDLR